MQVDTDFDVHTVECKKVHKIVCMVRKGPSKNRRVTPMMMPRLCPSGSRVLKTFFKSHNFFIMEKLPVSEEF